MLFMEYTIFIQIGAVGGGIPGFWEVSFNFVSQATCFWPASASHMWVWLRLFAFSFSKILNIRRKIQEHMLVLVTFAF